jgi:fumarate hydratase class II
VGTGINAPPDFDRDVAAEIANLTKLPFITAPNKFTVQGSHDALGFLERGTENYPLVPSIKLLINIRLLSCGSHSGYRRTTAAGKRTGFFNYAGES